MRDHRDWRRLPARPDNVTPLTKAIPADLLVLEVAMVRGRAIVAVQVYAGELRAGLRLAVEGTDQVWEVRGVAFVPPETREVGRLGLTLAPLGHEHTLRSGERLVPAGEVG